MKTHAEKEFEILEKISKDNVVLEFKDEILALVEKFMKSGQSGGSAPLVSGAIIHVIDKLLLFEPITPLTGADDEWTLVDDNIWQNKRHSAVFKDNVGVYFLDAIVFVDEDGVYYTSNYVKLNGGNTITSRQYIREFPFTPKTFYVDTIQIDGDSYVKDINQLSEVSKYYKFEI